MTSIRSGLQLGDALPTAPRSLAALPLPGHPETPLPSPFGHMKLSGFRTKTIENATAAGLDTAVQTFVTALTEERLIGAQFGRPDGGNYWCVLMYAD